ncbi:Uncharacterised protein [Cedecea lapagei]|uniref:Restriction endonuclease type IV Mrr domain-containing protein n=1 Tax=Cedecea lapagei TaxID=158823 RepID=A0A3S4J5N7_9ENTR|nr:hypothetical protein [Cedecea lapagei]VEC01525.1 Uncharacterised protein [Cedecea lapagei]
MEKIVSKKFEECRKVIKDNLLGCGVDFDGVDLYFEPDGGEYGNGKLLLIDRADLDNPIYDICSGRGINISSVDAFYAKDFARVMFLDRVSRALTHDAIVDYFVRIIRLFHSDVRIHHLVDRTEVVYNSLRLMPRASVLTVLPDEIKFVVLKDHIPFESIKVSWLESNATYYSKNSDANVLNRGSIIGTLSYEPAFSHSTKLYLAAFGVSIKSIVSIVDFLGEEDKSISFRLSRRLLDIPVSKGKPYEDLLNELLYYIFSNCYEQVEMHVQVPNEDRIRIRDIVIDNRDPKNNFLGFLRSEGVHYLLMDAKNYKKPLKTSDIDTFINYISENKRFGGFGIILSRNGASKNLMKQQIKMLRDSVEVVVLDESDMLEMIDLRALDRDPMSVIKNKLKRLQLQR